MLSKNNNKELFLDFSICIFLTLFIYILSKRYLAGGIGDDEQGVISNGYFIYKGVLPYRDFFVNKPLIFNFISYLSFITLGVNNCAYKLFPFLLIYPSAILFYFSLKKLNIQRFLAASISVYFYFLILLQSFHNFGNFNSETLGVIFTIYAFCSFCLFRNNLGSFLSGIFAAISINSKEPFLLFLLPLSLFVFLEEKPFKINKSKLLYLCLGFIFVNAIFVFYLIFTGSMDAYIDKNDWCYTYATKAKELGLVKIPDNFIGVFIYDLQHILEKYNYFFYFTPFFMIYLFSLSIRKHLNVGFYVCIISVLAGLYGISLGHRFFEHYFIIGIFPFVAFAVYCAKDFPVTKQFTVIFILLLSVNILPTFVSELTTNYKPHRFEDDFPIFMNKVLPIIKKYTKKTDKILIAGHPSLYYLTDRIPSSVHTVLEQHIFLVSSKKMPTEKRLSMFIDEINNYKPKIIYFQSEYMSPIHRMTFIQKVLFPFIKENNYFDCGNGLFVKPAISKEDREKYCIPTLDSVKLESSKSIVPFRVEVSSEKGDDFSLKNINDNDLTTSWLENNNNSAVITIYPKIRVKLKSIWFLPYRIYDIYQGWDKIKIKSYLSGRLVSEEKIVLPDTYKVGVQSANLKPVLVDKIELHLDKENINRKNIFGEVLEYPFNCGYTEILLQGEN